jgi:DNA-binding NarL/FixJ family response regulator
MKVVIIDKHILFREGLTSLLSNQPDFEVLGSIGTAEKGAEIVLDSQPDLVLLDVDLPDMNGLNILHTITASCPNTKTVVLTSEDDSELLFESIQAGADGFMLKDTPFASLLSSLRALERGEIALSRSMATRVVEEFRRSNSQSVHPPEILGTLTNREMDILILLGKNASNLEIAETLFIAENTVKVHVHNILDKLHLRNRREAGSLARYLGLIKVDPSIPSTNGHKQLNGRDH